jgi:cellulose synthase/poly-beta-1,6-N-acetylglucosamine synthase-like glycosyltransferase
MSSLYSSKISTILLCKPGKIHSTIKTNPAYNPSMSNPRVTIIILNWNGLEDTVECLESLKKITYPNYEVIVVDNRIEKYL